MQNQVKVLVNYLPQFHQIPENDKWWGKGFTDWNAVQKAKPLFAGHNQPRVPLNKNYYSLDDPMSIKWQVDLSNKYNIYGFAIYHYWFNSKTKLLTTPAEILLKYKDLKTNFMFLWDNATWKRTWSNVKHANDWAPNYDIERERKEDSGILAELIYGDEKDWKIHFDYLLSFFKDERYIKIDNKPVFGFFQPHNDFSTITKMCEYWDMLAKDNGFSGIYCMSRENYQGDNLKYRFRYTPLVPNNITEYCYYKAIDLKAKANHSIRYYDYDRCWKEIIRDAERCDETTFLSGFVNFDDTPRRGQNGRVITGGTPQKFGNYFTKLLKISKRQHKEFVFLTAWNEWAEGAYLEPDETNRYAYLEFLKQAIDEGNG